VLALLLSEAAPARTTPEELRRGERAARWERGAVVKKEEGAAGGFSKRKSRYSKLTCSLFIVTMLSF
jgi:hypothetical protein